MIEVVVYPAGGSPGQFVAEVGGTVLVPYSKTPLLAAARLLLAEHWDCGAEMIVMRHRDSPDVALRSTIAFAAGLTVEDAGNGKPVFAKWRAFAGVR